MRTPLRLALICITLAATPLLGQSLSMVGSGCTDSNGRISVLDANQLPTIGNLAFAFNLTMAPPNQQAFVFLSSALEPNPLAIGGGCNLYLEQTSLAQLIATGISPLGPTTTSFMGQNSWPFPIPNIPQLSGFSLYAQAATIDVTALGFVVSNALCLTFG